MKKNKKKLKKKTARRWLNRNQWKIACIKIYVFEGNRSRFLKQYMKCLEALK